jgi:hypothetical protein
MRWHAEGWVKLYTRIDGNWLRLSATARGLGSELLKYADQEGAIAEVGADQEPAEVLAGILAARPAEFPAVIAALRELLAGTRPFLTVQKGRVLIRNFVEAQERRSPEAARKARQRDRERAALRDRQGVTEDGQERDMSRDSHGTVTWIRSDPIRSEYLHSHAREASGETGSATEAAGPPVESVPRCDLRRLHDTWFEITKLTHTDGLHELADAVETAARVQTPPADPNEYAARCVRAFVAWVDGISNAARRPKKTPRKLVEHFSRVEEILAGTRDAVPKDTSIPPGRSVPRIPPEDNRPRPPPAHEVLERQRPPINTSPPPASLRASLRSTGGGEGP